MCVIFDCEKPIRYADMELCNMHYERLRRHGTTDQIVRDKTVRFCKIDGCGQVHCSLGYCKRHYDRLKATGDPMKVRSSRNHTIRRGSQIGTWKGDGAGYHAVHKRLASEFGPATEYMCQFCDSAADQWSYNHKDENEKVSQDGLPYSTDLKFYKPACFSCHTKLDRKRVVG